MKKTILTALLTVALVGASQATLVFNEEFDGALAGYNPDSGTALIGDNDWVDFSNRMTTDFSGNEGYATAVGGTESVLTGAANGNDPQIRSDFEPGFDKTLVTNVTLRIRIDVDRNDTFDDGLVNGNFSLFWGTDPYVTPGAQNGNSQLNFTLGNPTTLLDESNNGWHTATWSLAAGSLTQGTTGDIVRSLRIDPTNGPTFVGSSFEIDYLRVHVIPEPGAAALLGLGCAMVFFGRRRRAAS